MRIALLLMLLMTSVYAGESVTELLARARKEENRAAGKALVEKSIELGRANVAKSPTSPQAHYELALALFEIQDDPNAVKSVEEALKLKPDFAEACLLRGKLYGYAKDYSNAERLFLRATQMMADLVEAWYWLGCARDQQEKPKEALEAFQKTLALKEDHADAHYRVGRLLIGEKNKAEALPHFKRAAELRPKWVNAHFNAGVCLQNMWKFEESMAYIERALELEPNGYDIHETRIQVASGLGDAKRVDEAIAALKKVRDALPADKRKSLFVRERFMVGETRVVVAQYFELEGERAVRYSFNVFKPGSTDPEYRISLGSYEITNQLARETGDLKGDQRRFHLDGYYAGNEHRTFGFFNGEPGYGEIRKEVVAIIQDKRDALSSSKPGQVIIKQ